MGEMNDYSNDFKGVWFPRNLWLDKNISFIEKSILVVIKNLDKGDEHCGVTNNYLANFLQCGVSTITRAISHLKKMGYIEEVKGLDMSSCRKLRIKNNIDNELDMKWEDEELKQLIEQELEWEMLLHPKYHKNVRI